MKEYKILRDTSMTGSFKKLEGKINDLAKESWKVVSSFIQPKYGAGESTIFVIMEREIV